MRVNTVLRGNVGPTVLRWLARGLSALVVALIGGILVVNHPNLIEIIRSTRGQFLWFPIGVCAGMLLAWRWELAGGLVSLVSLGLFYAGEVTLWGKWPKGPFFLIFTLPATLFVASWLLARATGPSREGQASE